MDSLGNTVLFGGLLRIASPNGIPYFVFLMSGLIGWRLFERGVMYSTRSFSVYRKLMKRHHFPLFLVPLAGMAYPALEIAVYGLVLAGALAFYALTDGTLYLQAPPQLLLVLPAVLLLVALAVGVSLWTSVLNARAQDVRYVLRYVLPIWLYLTPVVYPTSKIPESWAWVTVVNPMAAPVELMKMGLLGVGRLTPASLGVSVGFAVVVLVSGAWFFNRQAAWAIEREDDDDELTDV